MGQAVIGPELEAAPNDVGLAEPNERCVHAEPRTLDALSRREVRETLALDIAGQLELVGGEILEIRGVVGRREGVRVPAVLLHDLIVFFGTEPLRAAEHHVLEQV